MIRQLLRSIAFGALLLVAVTIAAIHLSADDIAIREATVPSADGPIAVKLYSARGDGPRPVVVILHGRQGIESFAAAFSRYATAIAAQGMDACLVSYYSADDAAVMKSADPEVRKALFDKRIRHWSKLVGDVVGWNLKQKRSSGKVGLLGFSNGGFLAVAAAAADPRVTALVVFYGGVPSALNNEIMRLPPLLALHGDTDRVIPLASGTSLVSRARDMGGRAELIVYPRAGHGFDFDPARSDAKDALERAVSFLRQHLE